MRPRLTVVRGGLYPWLQRLKDLMRERETLTERQRDQRTAERLAEENLRRSHHPLRPVK